MKQVLCLAFILGTGFAAETPDTRLGHHHYEEAAKSDLAEAGPYRDTGRMVKMRTEAAAAFKTMQAAAKAGGVSLVPISGFRGLDYQHTLFESSRQRHGNSATEAAKWVAPPGYSEHHTGWSLDLGDGAAPAADVEQTFEKTGAFLWMLTHASEFGFEMSFPKGNSQGVSYEPWHWRYIGTPEAKKLFHPQEK